MSDFAKGGPQIRLENPVANLFEAFIIGNASEWEKLAAAELERAAPDVWLTLAEEAQSLHLRGIPEIDRPRLDFMQRFRNAVTRYCENTGVVKQNFCDGQHVVICGAGPSLREHASTWCKRGDQVWGCNSAAIWLHSHNRKITHAFTVDQTAHMVEEWYAAPDIEYMVASTVHPNLIEHLIAKGHSRRIRFFHNFVGVKAADGSVHPPVALGKCPGCEGKGCDTCQHTGTTFLDYEDWLYALLYPSTMRAGSGLNAVTRAVDLALFGNAAKITVLGADHALRFRKPPPKGAIAGSPAHLDWLRKHVIMHADGGNPLVSGATSMTMDGWICPDHDDGCDCKKRRLWVSKPDMLISAVFLVKMAKKLPQLQLIGDTLPNALMHKSEEFLARLPALVDSRGKPIEIW